MMPAKTTVRKKSSNPIPRPMSLSDSISRTMRSLNNQSIKVRKMRPTTIPSIKQKRFSTIEEYQQAQTKAKEARLAYLRKIIREKGDQNSLAKKILTRYERIKNKN